MPICIVSICDATILGDLNLGQHNFCTMIAKMTKKIAKNDLLMHLLLTVLAVCTSSMTLLSLTLIKISRISSKDFGCYS